MVVTFVNPLLCNIHVILVIMISEVLFNITNHMVTGISCSLPQRDDAPTYKFKDVVRKRDERQRLKGFDCKECAGVCLFLFICTTIF